MGEARAMMTLITRGLRRDISRQASLVFLRQLSPRAITGQNAFVYASWRVSAMQLLLGGFHHRVSTLDAG